MKSKPVINPKTTYRMRWYWWGLLGVLLILASYALAVRMVNSIDYLKYGTDFSSFWMAGKLILQGKSPYDMVAWGEGFPTVFTRISAYGRFFVSPTVGIAAGSARLAAIPQCLHCLGDAYPVDGDCLPGYPVEPGNERR